MKLLELIEPSKVVDDLEAEDRDHALEIVAEQVEREAGMPAKEITSALLEREQLGSTSVGGGFAIPHCKCKGLKKIIIALARLAKPLPFDDSGGDPVRFLFVVLSPPDQPAAHLQVLSQIARILKHQELRSRMHEAETPEAIVEALEAAVKAEGM